ncbi:MAG: hypothetical protein Q9225_003769 [Loekoesia sp. 1 TL-2023]
MAAPLGTPPKDEEDQVLPDEMKNLPVPVANLEAELGCFDWPLTDAAPRPHHGDSHRVFEAPTGSTSRLEPPSKTKSFYAFGLDGTLAWTTAAGELFQIASCIDNKLIGAEYKRSIERGQWYQDRGKMLNRAVNQPQGSGFGIGLSLGVQLEPFETSWVNNRWPRFSYQLGGLEIRLQYCIDSRSVIQEYQIRNTGQEELSLPYTFSSDICFLAHKGEPTTFHEVATSKCPERLLLFQNSEVLIRNQTEGCQLAMTLFLNAQRHSLWAKNQLSEDDERESTYEWPVSLYSYESESSFEESDEFEWLEDRLRKTILAGQLVDELEDADFRRSYRKYNDRRYVLRQSDRRNSEDFANCPNILIVPGGSTQELCAVMRLSDFSHQESGSHEPQSILPGPRMNINPSVKLGGNEMESTVEKIRDRQKVLIAKAKQFAWEPGLKGKRPIPGFMDDHLKLGARFVYAKFLHDHGWQDTALPILERLLDMTSKVVCKGKPISLLKDEVQYWLASLYMEQGNFSKAEETYNKALTQPISDETAITPDSASCLERIAWAQVHQKKYKDAHTNYSLLVQLPTVPRRAVRSNLGFIERMLGDKEQAISSFKIALSQTADALENSSEQLHARSGLFACLRTPGATPEECPEISESVIPYKDVISRLFQLQALRLPIKEGPFHFTITRQLESLLSTCSVPVTNDDGFGGVAFVDADPLGCLCEGRST